MPPPIKLGRSDFPSLREDGAVYVDKSRFVNEVLNSPADVLLYPRPRRFGKTLNMSMLKAFFEIGPDRTALFSDLEIWQDAGARRHFQRHPVIALTLKDTKRLNWADFRSMLYMLLSAEVARHREVLTSPLVDATVRARLTEVLNCTGQQASVLRDLSEALTLHHGSKPILLIDEYDAGILGAWENDSLRTILSLGLKDNPFLFKGVLTGILRVARESMFSGLNNVQVYSLLNPRSGDCFGFTGPEVVGLLGIFDRTAELDEVRRWYNGYRFGNATVYNPISILSMLAYPESRLSPYWVNTSGNDLVRSLLLGQVELDSGIAALLGGGSLESRVEEDVPLRELTGRNIWSLFLFAGYLSAKAVRVESGRTIATLVIPNLEVRGLWEDTFSRWLDDRIDAVEPLQEAILAGDANRVEGILREMLNRHVSYHDVASNQDEAFYHAFVLGLLVTMEKTHTVRSNRETGLGRADVQLIPKRPGLPGVVLEFKRRARGDVQPGELEGLADEALAQIQTHAYTTEIEAAGASVVRRLGIAFVGKEVVVRGVGEPSS